MKNSKRISNIVELQVMSELLKYGEVSIPYGNNARYDCILDFNNHLLRIQIKTARYIDDNRFQIPFANTRSGANGSVRKVYTSNEVDFIATYYKNKLYMFPTGNCTNLMTISFNYPDNGLKNTINLAENYEGTYILNNL